MTTTASSASAQPAVVKRTPPVASPPPLAASIQPRSVGNNTMPTPMSPPTSTHTAILNSDAQHAYIEFCRRERPLLTAEHPSLEAGELDLILSARWKRYLSEMTSPAQPTVHRQM